MEHGVFITEEEYNEIEKKVSDSIMNDPELKGKGDGFGSMVLVISGTIFAGMMRKEIFKETNR